ncbi:hypothetical protein SLEP1_g7305 [Rubroshorea leprosula]|uniref:Uncharacterized protein n=1 Tax=Rubroshorea leprosula TaxID=152421 RepID=A0AAV5I782_9ROSI|nr:hypothetical protein SLEP1_g7305 [Rubroshorea leprosula]
MVSTRSKIPTLVILKHQLDTGPRDREKDKSILDFMDMKV